jgi:hypothetical protein
MNEFKQKMRKEFKILKNDIQRWKWILKNKDKIIVFLDNDDTFAAMAEDKYNASIGNEEIFEFDTYLGYSDGVIYLLEALGIESEVV